MKTTQYQPKTGAKCHCRPGQQRDNCPSCEGTGWQVDFKAIRKRKNDLFPLKDGDLFKGERVAGEIKPPHKEPICWTLTGNWYRRSDGEQMTSAAGTVMTVKRFFKLRRLGKA